MLSAVNWCYVAKICIYIIGKYVLRISFHVLIEDLIYLHSNDIVKTLRLNPSKEHLVTLFK